MKVREHAVMKGTEPELVLIERGTELVKRRIVAEHGQHIWDLVAGSVQQKNAYRRDGFNYVTIAVDTEIA